MRNRLLISGGSVLATLAVAAAMATGMVRDTDEARIDALETRVARLEEVVGIATPGTVESGQGGAATRGEDGEDGEPGAVITIPGSSSSQSQSSSQGSSSYTASWASSGNQTMPLRIPRGGTYQVTVVAGGPVEVRIEDDGREVVPPIVLTDASAGTVSTSVELESGAYVLDVTASGQWTVLVTSAGS